MSLLAALCSMHRLKAVLRSLRYSRPTKPSALPLPDTGQTFDPSRPPTPSIQPLHSDVLLYLFEWCRDIEPILLWVISHTCREWRTLVLQHTSLWARITINAATLRYFRPKCLNQCVSTWLDRAGTKIDLHITIDLCDSPEWGPCQQRDGHDISKMVLLTCREAHRWRSFTYKVDRSLTGWFLDWSGGRKILEQVQQRLEMGLPRLLTMTCLDGEHGYFPGVTPRQIYLLLSPGLAPNLHTITLGNVDPWRLPGIQWKTPHLTYKFLSSGLCHYLDSVLVEFPFLETLDLSGCPGSRTFTTDGPACTRLPRLSKLTITPNVFMEDLLPQVDTPALECLILDGSGVPIDDGKADATSQDYSRLSRYSPSILHQFIKDRQLPFLTHLTLHLPYQSIPWATIAQMATLEDLRIVKPITDLFWANCVYELFPLYHQTTRGGSVEEWCLPHLSVVSLDGTLPHEWPFVGCTEEHEQWPGELRTLLIQRWRTARESGERLALVVVQSSGPDWDFILRENISDFE